MQTLLYLSSTFLPYHFLPSLWYLIHFISLVRLLLNCVRGNIIACVHSAYVPCTLRIHSLYIPCTIPVYSVYIPCIFRVHSVGWCAYKPLRNVRSRDELLAVDCTLYNQSQDCVPNRIKERSFRGLYFVLRRYQQFNTHLTLESLKRLSHYYFIFGFLKPFICSGMSKCLGKFMEIIELAIFYYIFA